MGGQWEHQAAPHTMTPPPDPTAPGTPRTHGRLVALPGPGPGWSQSRGRGPLALLTRTLLVSAEGAGGGSHGGPPSVQSPPTGAIRPRPRWPQAAHRPPRVPSDPIPFSPLLSHPWGTSRSPKNPKMLWDSTKTPHRHLGVCHGAWPHLRGVFHPFFHRFTNSPRSLPGCHGRS